MDHRLVQILENTVCLSKSQLQGYLDKSLQPEELYAVEMHLIECPICNDAVDGLNGVQQLSQLLNTIPVMTKLPVAKNREKKPADSKTDTSGVAPSAPDSKSKTEHAGMTNAEIRNRPVMTATKNNPPKSSWGRQWGKPLGIAAAIVFLFGLLWYFELGGAVDVLLQTGEAERPSSQSDTSLLAEAIPPVQPEQFPSAPLIKDSVAAVVALKDSIKTPAKSAETPIKKTEEIKKAEPPKEGSVVKKEPAISTPVATAVKPSEQKERQTPVSRQPVAAPQDNHADVTNVSPPEHNIQEQAPVVKNTAQVSMGKPITQSDFDKGMELYRQQQYGSAILYFRSAVNQPSDPKYYDALYYSAMAYKNMGKKRKAINSLKKIVVSDTAPNKSEAQRQLDALQ